MRTKYFKVYRRCTGNSNERIKKTISIQLPQRPARRFLATTMAQRSMSTRDHKSIETLAFLRGLLACTIYRETCARVHTIYVTRLTSQLMWPVPRTSRTVWRRKELNGSIRFASYSQSFDNRRSRSSQEQVQFIVLCVGLHGSGKGQ